MPNERRSLLLFAAVLCLGIFEGTAFASALRFSLQGELPSSTSLLPGGPVDLNFSLPTDATCETVYESPSAIGGELCEYRGVVGSISVGDDTFGLSLDEWDDVYVVVSNDRELEAENGETTGPFDLLALVAYLVVDSDLAGDKNFQSFQVGLFDPSALAFQSTMTDVLVGLSSRAFQNNFINLVIDETNTDTIVRGEVFADTFAVSVVPAPPAVLLFVSALALLATRRSEPARLTGLQSRTSVSG